MGFLVVDRLDGELEAYVWYDNTLLLLLLVPLDEAKIYWAVFAIIIIITSLVTHVKVFRKAKLSYPGRTSGWKRFRSQLDNSKPVRTRPYVSMGS